MILRGSFTWTEQRGEGWLPDFMHGPEGIAEVLVVHDMLDHFPGDAFSVEHELMAMGTRASRYSGREYCTDTDAVKLAFMFADMAKRPIERTEFITNCMPDFLIKIIQSYEHSEKEKVTGWMNLGYHRGLRRYACCDLKKLHSLHLEMNREVFKHENSRIGDKLLVEVDLQVPSYRLSFQSKS